MKRSSLLFCLLLLCAPLYAQEASDAPKEFSLTFNYSFSDKTRVTSIEFGYQREFPNAKSVPFDSTIIGKKGLISKETLSFLSNKGEVLGTLSSEFDASGKLQSQKISEANRAARVLSWFKTAAKSPQLSVAGSTIKASYTLKSGKLNERLLVLQTPGGIREFRSRYDTLGRRQTDNNESTKGPMSVRFFYDDQGLARFTTAGTGDKSREVTLGRAPNGTISQIITKEEGVLIARMIPSIDDRGTSMGMRIEGFEDGILSTVATMSPQGKSSTQEEYDAGVLVSRRSFTMDPKAGQKLQTLEEFESGHLRKRTQYDENGAVNNITTFNPDGSINATQTYKDGVEVAPTN